MSDRAPGNLREAVPFLRIADMERSLRFYVDGLGFAIAQRWVDGGSVRWCRLERGGAALMLQDFRSDAGGRWSPGGELGLGVAIVFICEDAVALWREAAGRGLELSRPFVGNGMWVTAAIDPDGYRVEIESPTDAPEATVLAGDAIPESRGGEGAAAGGGPPAPAVATLEERVQRVLQEDVAVVPYDPAWPEAFLAEKAHLLSCLPTDLVRRIEHFGSTAVPGLAAKPVVDMLVEVTDLEATKSRIAPQLEAQGYEYFWRPTFGDDGPPFYAWFIKRDPRSGARTHHIHMVERTFSGHWERLLFRDYLADHPEVAREYGELKLRLASELARDRAAYTRGKSEFVERVTVLAKSFYAAREPILTLGEMEERH